ncbi:hypothetical protein GGG16DRAFT_119641 [Schizophyllum commune]
MEHGPLPESPLDHRRAAIIPAPSHSSTLLGWLKDAPRRARDLGRAAMRRFQEVGFARRTGGATAELKAAIERTHNPNTGIPPPEAFCFRPSIATEYQDLFTRAPASRSDFPPSDLSLPAPVLVREEPRNDHRLPIDEHMRLATPRPTLQHSSFHIPPPPGAHYVPPSCPPTPPASQDHETSGEREPVPVCRLVPANFLMRFDGFPVPEMLFLLQSIDGGPPPHFKPQYGTPIPILSLTDDPGLQELWPVEAIRFDPATQRAIILAAYDGCAVPVLVPYSMAEALPTRLKVWQMFRDELAELASAPRRYALTKAQLSRMHEEARARVIWEVTKLVSHKTVPPLQHPAPNDLGLHAIRLLGMHALPGPQ